MKSAAFTFLVQGTSLKFAVPIFCSCFVPLILDTYVLGKPELDNHPTKGVLKRKFECLDMSKFDIL